jgi:hypothetical protein
LKKEGTVFPSQSVLCLWFIGTLFFVELIQIDVSFFTLFNRKPQTTARSVSRRQAAERTDLK